MLGHRLCQGCRRDCLVLAWDVWFRAYTKSTSPAFRSQFHREHGATDEAVTLLLGSPTVVASSLRALRQLSRKAKTLHHLVSASKQALHHPWLAVCQSLSPSTQIRMCWQNAQMHGPGGLCDSQAWLS